MSNQPGRLRNMAMGAGLLALAAGPNIVQGQAAPARRPNIIFILADDLGYGDLGAFYQNQRQGHPTEPAELTPHLDALAADGIRLTDHYCPAPVSAPSRASLLSGVHQGHSNVRDNQFDKALEDNHTLATVLRKAGYSTAAIGKWGLQGKPRTAPPDWPAHPLNRGFDYYYGYIRHNDGHEHYPKEGPYQKHKEVWDNRTEVSKDLDKCYTADLFTARAKQWIIDHEKAHAQEPFFMYLAYDTPHATTELPTQAYPAGAGLKGGMQWLGKPGQMINTASGKIDSWYHPDYANATWDHDNNPATAEVPWPDVYKRYATAVRRIDDAVGDLSQLLKDLQIDSNTLVVFTSDNGPSQESYLKQQLHPTFFSSYGPFDGIKRDCWEGGMRVPTIVRYPGVIPAGKVSALPCSSPDWMPTFAELAGVRAPARSDGVSLLPTLTGHGTQRTPLVYVEYFEAGKTPNYPAFEASRRGRIRRQMQALRMGDFVGVRYNIKSQADDFEIYNAVSDPKETHNLAQSAEYSALQQKMKDKVLQVRRPDAGARRPYDRELIPATPGGGQNPGVRWSEFAGSFPWAPQLDGAAASSMGVAPQVVVLSGKGDRAMEFTGSIVFPADGEYELSLATDTGAVLRLHEATVIDADYGYVAGREITQSVRVKAGRHPFRLVYVHRGSETPMLKLAWKGPGIEKQEIPAGAFFRD